VESDEIDLPTGSSLVMQPGGTHLMLEGLTREVAEGDTVRVVLRFRKAAPLTVEVPVLSFDDLAERMAE
jgi:copper(I)-binding protein